MENELTKTDDGLLAPDRDQSRLIEAERVVRYGWAAQVAAGRRVLDAGCGTAYGSRLLAQAGAVEVIGIDLARSVLETVTEAMPASVRLQEGDLRRLEFEDNAFGLVVCFEVIEYLEDASTVLDELTRVLAPEGLLLVSSPNRSVDPHHVDVHPRDELAAELATRLSHVRLTRQHDYAVSALLSDSSLAQGDGVAIEDVRLHKLIADSPGDEIYTVAMASNAELPVMRELAAVTGSLELREWFSVFEAQASAADDKDAYIDELEARVLEQDRMAQLLIEAEARLAAVPELDLRIADLEYELSATRQAADAARQEAMELDQMLIYGRRMLRYVRPAIKPLRKVRRRLRS